jgi:Fungal N-terminal domain of STAND proteins
MTGPREIPPCVPSIFSPGVVKYSCATPYIKVCAKPVLSPHLNEHCFIYLYTGTRKSLQCGSSHTSDFLVCPVERAASSDYTIFRTILTMLIFRWLVQISPFHAKSFHFVDERLLQLGPMDELFSAAANIAAFLCLVDVACRCIKELYVFISALKNSAAEMRKLEQELQDLDNIVCSLRSNCSGFIGVASAPADTTILTSLLSCMKSCNEEPRTLKQILQSSSAPREALNWFGAKVKWVFDEDKVGKSSLRVARTKASLNIVLSMLGSESSEMTTRFWS